MSAKVALRLAPARIVTRWSFGVLGLYVASSVLLFGWQLWPHPGRDLVGPVLGDSEMFVWSFAWWSHALTSFTNPFVSHAVYAPVGANLMWTASAPGLALLFAPLTLLVGPTAAYNVAALLVPAAGAWTAFLLCRYLTRSVWAAVIGGYLYGFSSYAVGHEYAGDLHLGGYLLPLVALVVIRYVRGELRGIGLAWRLGLLLALQFTISTELVLTLTLALVVGLPLAYASFREHRDRIAAAAGPIVGAYAIAAAVAAPFVAYAVKGFGQGTSGLFAPDGDLLNIVVPTRLIGAGGSTFASFTARFAGNDGERDLYLGIPILLILGLYLWRCRRRPVGRFLFGAVLCAWVVALGSSLRVDGHRVAALPWSLVGGLPLFKDVITPRVAVYAALAASVGVALWIASTRGRFRSRPVVLPALAVVSLLPATGRVSFAADPPRPQFFSQALYKECVPRGETLLVFPFARFGDSMLWQAESGFWFKMAEGNLGRDTYPPGFVFADPTVVALQFDYYGPGPRPTMAALGAFSRKRDVDRVVSVESGGYPSGEQMHAFGPLQVIGDVYIAPACGYDSLAGDSRSIPGQAPSTAWR